MLINRKLDSGFIPWDRRSAICACRKAIRATICSRWWVPLLRIKLRGAIHRVMLEKARIVIPGGRTNYEGKPGSFKIAVQPALIEGEDLLLVCF